MMDLAHFRPLSFILCLMIGCEGGVGLRAQELAGKASRGGSQSSRALPKGGGSAFQSLNDGIGREVRGRGLGQPFGPEVPLPRSSQAPAPRVQRNDFNGDGKSDLLWRQQGSGMVYVMPMLGKVPQPGAVAWTESNPDWLIVGSGDLDGDRKGDLVWWQRTTGMLYGMLMDGTSVKGGGVVHVEPDTAWQPQAVADFDGNGHSDLLWRNTSTGMVYIMPLLGTQQQPGAVVWTETDPAWGIQGTGDFDGDGRADLLWRNSSSGMLYLMMMNGPQIRAGEVLYTEADTAWVPVAVLDFTGDGTSDLLWRQATGGQVYAMPIQGASVQSGAVLWTETDQNWLIMGAGDYDGDGCDDLVWWNRTSGVVYQMLLNGAAIKDAGVVWTEPDTTWLLQGGETRAQGNLPPRNVLILGPSSVVNFHTATYQLSASDPEGGAVTFSKKTEADPFALAGNLLTFTPTTIGNQALTILAKDIVGNVTEQSLAVLVVPNTAPTLAVPSLIDIGALETSDYTLGDARDADNDPVAYSSPDNPTFVTISGNQMKVAPATFHAGHDFTFKVVATDGFVISERSVTVKVGALPDGTITTYPTSDTQVLRGSQYLWVFSATSPISSDNQLEKVWSLNDGAGGAAPEGASIDPQGVFTWDVPTTAALAPTAFLVTCEFRSGVKARVLFRLTPKVNSAPTFSVASLDGAGAIRTTVGNWSPYAAEASLVLAGNSPGSLPIESVISLAGTTPGDVDMQSADRIRFEITRVTIPLVPEVDVTYTDSPLFRLTPWSFDPATGTFRNDGILTFSAPKVGELRYGPSNTPLTNEGLRVEITARDLAGNTAKLRVNLATRSNTAPILDNYGPAPWVATSGDDLSFVDVQASEGTESIWTLKKASLYRVGAPMAFSDPEGDLISMAGLDLASVNAGFTLSASSISYGPWRIKRVPTTDQSRSTFEFTVHALDRYGFAATPVTFRGTVSGRVFGMQTKSLVLDKGTTTIPSNFSMSGSSSYGITVDPFFSSPGSPNFKKYGSELPDFWPYWGDSAGHFTFNSVPSGHYLLWSALGTYPPNANANVLPLNTYIYTDASTVDLSACFAGRVTQVDEPKLFSAVTAAKGWAAGSRDPIPIFRPTRFVNWMSRINGGNMNSLKDAVQMVSDNLGAKAFFGVSTSTSAMYPGALPFSNTVEAIHTNNGSDLYLTLDINTAFAYGPEKSRGDKVRMVSMIDTPKDALTTGAAGCYVDIWTIKMVGFSNFEIDIMDGIEASQFWNFTYVLDDLFVNANFIRSSFNAHAKAMGSSAAATYTGENFQVLNYPHGVALGNIEKGPPTLLQFQDLYGVSAWYMDGKKDVDFGSIAFGNPFGGTPVRSYTYNTRVYNSDILSGWVTASLGLMTTDLTSQVAPLVSPVSNLKISTSAGTTLLNTLEKASTLIAGYANIVAPDVAPVLPITAQAYNGASGATDHVTLTWTNPVEVGFSGVIIELYDLGIAGWSVPLPGQPSRTIYTKATAFPIPTAWLNAGNMYLIKVRSVAMPGVDFSKNPMAKTFPYAWAEVVSVPIRF